MASLGFDKRRKKWRVRYRATNKNHEVFSGSKSFLTKTKALEFYVEMKKQECLWRSEKVDTYKLIQTVVEQFYLHIKSLTHRTQKNYIDTIDAFIAGLSVTRVQQIKDSHIKDYLHDLSDRGCNNRSLNARLTAIKSFCKFYSKKLTIMNPASFIDMFKEDRPITRHLTQEEYLKILDCCINKLTRDRFVFLANTGLKASEFANLTKTCFSNNSLTVVGSRGKQRTIPLNTRTQEIARRFSSDFPATPNALYLMCQRINERAKLKPFGSLAFRHFFAIQLLLRGVPLWKVSKLLGHVSVRTTETRYAHFLTEDLDGVTECLQY